MISLARKLITSFSYAFDGLQYATRTQLNMKVHMLAAVLVAALTLCLPLSVPEVLFITAAVFIVIISELANTAIETVVDMISSDYHPLAKIAKDVAAAAVMVSAFFALITGVVIFLPIFAEIIQRGPLRRIELTLPSIAAVAGMLFIVIGACLRSNRRRSRYNKHVGYSNTMYQEWISAMQHSEEMLMIDHQDLHEEERELLNQAIAARQQAYVPYSGFPVGSAVRSEDGYIYIGCNIENAAYGSTNCAERSALFHAVSRGAKPRTYRMLAVVGATAAPITPCGACRQVLAELCSPSMPVILANIDGKAVRTTVAALLPGAFTEQALHSLKAAGTQEGE